MWKLRKRNKQQNNSITRQSNRNRKLIRVLGHVYRGSLLIIIHYYYYLVIYIAPYYNRNLKGALQHHDGKDSLNKYVFKDDNCLTLTGRLFHASGPATEKARSSAFVFVQGTIN